MFIHAVLFEISSRFVKTYIRDCKMWAKKAKGEPGFIGYKTLKRVSPVRNGVSNGVNQQNQFSSVYCWQAKKDHEIFMDANHEKLVKKSLAPVKVLGYYNFNILDELAPPAFEKKRKK